MAAEEPAVEVRGLTVEADGARILGPVDLTVEPGEILLVTGPSGSGKSTLLRALVGSAQHVYRLRVSGRVRVAGLSPEEPGALASRVFYVPQEPWYAIDSPYTLYEVAFHTGTRSVSEALKLLGRLGLEGKALESTAWLSAGEAQRLLYAEALASGRKVFLVDEVTSYLDPANRVRVVEAAVEAAETGTAVIVVDHNVELWVGKVSKTLYIDRGRAVLYDDPRETPVYPQLARLREKLGELRSRLPEPGEPVLEARGLWYRYPDSKGYTLQDIDITVRGGEIVWVRGASGSGKSTLLKVLAGIYKPSWGKLRRRAGCQLVPENPLLYLSEPTPREELNGDVRLAELVSLADRLDTPILHLSSGERRRLALASAYARAPRLLLVDEPTVGLDPWNAVRVLELLVELASRGAGIVVATHNPEVGGVASRVVEV